MRILSIGGFNGVSNTCLHRHWALTAIATEIDKINVYEKPINLRYKIANRFFLLNLPIRLPDISNINSKIKSFVSEKNYDIVWIDKGLMINKKTLEYIKQMSPNTKIVSYSPDNMAIRHNQSQNYLSSISSYDFIFTNKSYILNQMLKMGAKNVQFVNNSYEDTFHYPRFLEADDYDRLGGDIGFVGAWEDERCKTILYLVENGLKVRVFGGGKWLEFRGLYPNLTIEAEGLYSDDYAKSFQAFKICLCFLRKMNFDLQTTRSIEIPACGGFMLAERTYEHTALFEEAKEADFFSSNEELFQKCQYYLTHAEKRKKIALAGRLRCVSSGYSNVSTIKRLINSVFNTV
ncbi:CgeB family protein [Sphingobacterium pedocola]|uniref:Spore protein YkvP/CgeB glycosyl transferase-like domain-containing protein n=1 Tax=Sphingobacterium pedocola TaxID=2082722 RepID=A0ABR9T1V8_9SPHI|nr:glycosyltransferase [Sphingobacterium pedocola]MBE8719326.1 hypothetical protein [Sphingobacterium pedocola]